MNKKTLDPYLVTVRNLPYLKVWEIIICFLLRGNKGENDAGIEGS